MNSPTNVVAKLNLNKYETKLILNQPEDIAYFNELQYDSEMTKEKYDLIFVFIFNMDQFKEYLDLIIRKQAIHENGYLFFAYPKKNNRKYKEYIDRDSFFEQNAVNEEGYVSGSTLKFSRMVSMDDVFTVIGLKSQAPRKSKPTNAKSSQRVDDYVDYISSIREYLNSDQELLELYDHLTAGYQKDWARYVYSAKKSETQEKRLQQMKDILAQGYKSLDLYRRREQ
ncbi:YdeI/OmpD-associated family protein [Paenibacillus woosongensis]|uniref:YdeI/OmpD-associated family protein n=2 Tax=Paenibacillus woosongensis TaxID=307580 RepID=A0AA95I7Y7_9BACL|nr:YdeI/OmpD-associated family protein [Paenibacillus woosongensis]WHX51435.1 YdeI/OmpD-associated family protein [Paenibacillus woosongensis]